jgi:hypothetical protein
MKTLKSKLGYALCILLTCVLCVGCYPTEVHETINRTKHIEIETEVIVKTIPQTKEFRIVTIDSCEYIVFKDYGYGGNAGWGYGGICHKENCKYCAERAKANAR